MSELPSTPAEDAGAAGRPRRFLSSQQAAEYCSADRRTLLRWIDKGLLNSHRPAGGRHRILPADLCRFMRETGMPVPRELLQEPRVAVVDDDAHIVKMLVRLIAGLLPHAEVGTASDGFAAGVLVASFRPHLLFIDLVMPGVSGLEVCREIRSGGSETAVVVVSGNLTPQLKEELLALGVERCLAKPFRPDQVGAAIDDLLPG